MLRVNTGRSLPRNGAVILSALLLLIGGGGAEGAYFNGIIAAVGAIILASVVSMPLRHDRGFWRNWLPAFAALGFLVIPLLQVVPLPPSIWKALAGRPSIASTLALVGAAEQWRPLSLTPAATLRAVTFVLFPLSAFFLALKGEKSTHRRSVLVLALCAAVSAVVGAAQLALGNPEWLSFYGAPTTGAASGIFANPNHQALFMAFGILASAVIIRDKRSIANIPPRPSMPDPIVSGAWAGILFFSLMALATGARAGVMLLIIALPGGLLIAKGKGSLLRWAALFFGVFALLVVLVLVYPSTNSLGVRESFRLGADARYTYLPDILYTLGQYWPAGSGLGSFVPVFTPNENLDLVGSAYLNHAHNDFLEWAIETGLPGAAWLAFTAILVALYTLRRLKGRDTDIGYTIGALLVVMLAGLHSLVDYPLRTATLASVFAFSVGFLCANTASPKVGREPELETAGLNWRRIAAIAVALPFAVFALWSNAVQHAVRLGDFTTAERLNPDNPDVLVHRSEIALRAKQNAQAESWAVRALVQDPLSAPALRQLAFTRQLQNKPSGDIWEKASALGWRDAPTQFWAFRQGMLGGQLAIAALRGDALLRTEPGDTQFLTLFRAAAKNPAMAREIASRIRMNPPWRPTFFALPSTAAAPEVAGSLAVLIQMAKEKEATRADAKGLISYFLAGSQWAKAVQVYSLVVPRRGSADLILDDGGFDRTAEDYALQSTPFDWQTVKGGPVSSNIETFPPSRLVLDSSGETNSIGAERYVVVNPGNYRMTFMSRSDNAESFRLRLLCMNSSKEVAVSSIRQSSSFTPNAVRFTVPANCPLVRLVLEGLPNGVPATGEFDDFEMKRD